MIAGSKRSGCWKSCPPLASALSILHPDFLRFDALHLRSTPKEWSVRRDVISYNSVLAALKRSGQWENTLHIMQQMRAASVPLRTSTFARDPAGLHRFFLGGPRVQGVFRHCCTAVMMLLFVDT